MEQSTKTPSAEELLRKIQELEKRQSQLKQKISKLMLSGNLKEPEPLAMKLTEAQYFNIMQSLGQALHIYDIDFRIIFWSRGAENLYGFTPDEVYGKTPTELLVEPKDASLCDDLLERSLKGETWTGEFPIKNKKGERFVVIATNTPFRDEIRGIIGGLCISSDSRPYHARKPAKPGFDSPQPLQISIASKISNLVSISYN
ncbi:unnamed protein product [Lactuca saligna]|nr:unnamed protein product [Lactuca saligna]